MKYVMCPHCGRRLCKGEPGTKVEVDCPKCGKTVSVLINGDNLYIIEKPLPMQPPEIVLARSQA